MADLKTRPESLRSLLAPVTATPTQPVAIWGKSVRVAGDQEQKAAAEALVRDTTREKITDVRIELAPQYATAGFTTRSGADYALATRAFTAEVTVERDGKLEKGTRTGYIRTGELPGSGKLTLDALMGRAPQDVPTREAYAQTASRPGARDDFRPGGIEVKPIANYVSTPFGGVVVRKGVNPIVDANMNLLNWWSTALNQGFVPTPGVAAQVWTDGLMGKDSVKYVVGG